MMKQLMALLLALAFSMTAAVAETVAPEDKKVTTNTDFGVEAVYRKYDTKFYDAPSGQPGEVVKVSYTTHAYGGDPLEGWVNVYVPYGYDASQPYNIIYFFHGTNETQDSFIGDERAKNALDNMIQMGVAEPFLMVFPTYYYDYEARAIDIPAFMTELREAIMPAVESQYNTYAETADTVGFAASRAHRAFAGYSRGSYATWHTMFNMLDTAKWWLPLSGAISGEKEMEVPGPAPAEQVAALKAALEKQGDYADDYYLYIGCGGPRDMMYDVVTGLVQEMANSGDFSYGLNPKENNWYFCLSTEVHQTLMSRFYFYNAFEVLFK